MTNKVTQHVAPQASAKRIASSRVANLVMLLLLDWHEYRHLGMTPEIRDRTIAGLKSGKVDPITVCESLGIPSQAISREDRDKELLDSARSEFVRVVNAGVNVLGS